MPGPLAKDSPVVFRVVVGMVGVLPDQAPDELAIVIIVVQQVGVARGVHVAFDEDVKGFQQVCGFFALLGQLDVVF